MHHGSMLALFISCLALTACASLQPDRAPALEPDPVPVWTSELEAMLPASGPLPQPFWRASDDALFADLVEIALANNADLAIATERVREARADLKVTKAGARPNIGFGASATGLRLSENGTIPAGQVPGVDTEQALFDLGLDASWELDLFGRNRAERDVSAARLASIEEQLADVRVSLIAELSINYVDLRAAQEEKAVLANIISDQTELLEAVRLQRAAGEASDLDVHRALAGLNEFEAQAPAFEATIQRSAYRIATLMGVMPSQLPAQLFDAGALPESQVALPAAVLSDALRRRPDIRQAERDYVMAARSADLTRLNFYPTVSLFASVGPNTTSLDDIVDPASLAGELGALLAWTLFDGGERSGLLEAADARRVQAELAYRKAVLAAMEEVETAASDLMVSQRELEQRRQLAEDRARIAQMSRIRYEGGVETLVDLLISQQDEAHARMDIVRLRSALLTARVRLEKALSLSLVED